MYTFCYHILYPTTTLLTVEVLWKYFRNEKKKNQLFQARGFIFIRDCYSYVVLRRRGVIFFWFAVDSPLWPGKTSTPTVSTTTTAALYPHPSPPRDYFQQAKCYHADGPGKRGACCITRKRAYLIFLCFPVSLERCPMCIIMLWSSSSVIFFLINVRRQLFGYRFWLLQLLPLQRTRRYILT